jgi:deoxyribodipyrimidine photo-lyase
LHQSLEALSASLEGGLLCYQGDPLAILKALVVKHGVTHVYWHRAYSAAHIARDTEIKQALRAMGVSVVTENGRLLWEPWTIHKADGTPYQVFTPFYRKGCLQAPPPRFPLEPPTGVTYLPDSEALPVEALGLMTPLPWGEAMLSQWRVGEEAAFDRLDDFLAHGLAHYKEGRNYPAKPYVSRLSPHLRWGEISPNQVWYAAKETAEDDHVDHFCSELGWREFSYSQLYCYPDLPEQNLKAQFDAFSWREDPVHLSAWQRGQTGIPLVDAGMRELWQTGYIHNRVRMVVGSFLVKNLRLDWRAGERWFWDALVDADLASNSASWQWVAGCGADAAPYFRIFNPVTQGQKFDPQGEYIRRFVPEIAALPDRYLAAPWTAPAAVLAEAGVVLGETYPQPIVDLKASREAALEAFQLLKAGR